MSLMSRIKVHSFLDMTSDERTRLLSGIRDMRESDIAEAKRRAGKKTKSSIKAHAKRTKSKASSRVPTKSQASALLSKLSSAQLKLLLEINQ